MSAYAFVTGAAGGIGRAIAENLASRGYNLLITDRNSDGLQLTADNIRTKYQQDAHTIVLDLSERDTAEKLLQWTAPYHDNLTVVVNNAGYGLNAAFADLPLSEHLNLISVNVNALVSISYLFLPVLRQKEKGWLLNIGSTTAYQSIPYLNTYASSKAFVVSFTRALRYELKDTSVSVTCVSPGSTDTDFVHRAAMSDRTKKIADRYNMTPEQVAIIAVDGLFNKRAEVLPGFTNSLHAFLVKFFPKSFIERTGAKIYKPRQTDKKWTYSLAQEA